MQNYENWSILQDNKILRAEFLAEIALAEFENGQTLLFEKHKKEFVSLCILLNTPLLHATFMLELADLAGKKDKKDALGLYKEAEVIFRRSGCPVGVAEAILGKHIMAWATGDAIETHDLQEARDTFTEENLPWNSELIDNFLSNREDTKERDTIIDNFYENIHKHWREFLGKAGWLTSLSTLQDLEK
jgi:hypothetical protein